MSCTVLAVLFFLGIAPYGGNGETGIMRLAHYVKSHSDPDLPPQPDAHTPVEVSFQYAVLNIADVDQEHNTFTMETYAMAAWNTGISWNPADYGGIDAITLPAKRFWTPSLQPINTAVEIRNLGVKKLMLYNTGKAYYERFLRIQNLCDVSHVRTGSSCNSRASLWGYSKDQVVVVDIRPEETGSLPYFEGSKYQIVSVNQSLIDFPFDGKTYQIVDLWMTIQEKARAHGREPMGMFFEWH